MRVRELNIQSKYTSEVELLEGGEHEIAIVLHILLVGYDWIYGCQPTGGG